MGNEYPDNPRGFPQRPVHPQAYFPETRGRARKWFLACSGLPGSSAWGVDEALKSSRIEEVIERYPMVHIFILCVDRDGRPGRRHRLDEIEAEFDATQTFLAENAWEELETWVLAGVDLPNNWNWSDLRGEIDVKELYFEPLVARLGLSDSPGGGRKALGEAASQRIRAIRQKCPEDFDSLATRLQQVL